MCHAMTFSALKNIFFDVDIVEKKRIESGLALSVLCSSWVHNILTTVMTRVVVDKSTDNAKPHSICQIIANTVEEATRSPF